MIDDKLNQEFNRQLQNLIRKGYPQLVGKREEDFIELINPLIKNIPQELPALDLEKGRLPYVIVINSDLIPAEIMMEKVEREDKEGTTKLFPHTSTDFQVINKIKLPESRCYLLIDIDRGKQTLNITPENALKMIEAQNRTPLTINEGIAIMTHYPDFLQKNNCFSLLASRNPKDQRVPAIWINAQKHPNLGWCWDRNPHTWLGSASAKGRIS